MWETIEGWPIWGTFAKRLNAKVQRDADGERLPAQFSIHLWAIVSFGGDTTNALDDEFKQMLVKNSFKQSAEGNDAYDAFVNPVHGSKYPELRHVVREAVLDGVGARADTPFGRLLKCLQAAQEISAMFKQDAQGARLSQAVTAQEEQDNTVRIFWVLIYHVENRAKILSELLDRSPEAYTCMFKRIMVCQLFKAMVEDGFLPWERDNVLFAFCNDQQEVDGQSGSDLEMAHFLSVHLNPTELMVTPAAVQPQSSPLEAQDFPEIEIPHFIATQPSGAIEPQKKRKLGAAAIREV